MKGMVKINEFTIEETSVRVTILGDRETGGCVTAMAILTPPAGYIMTTDRGCIPDTSFRKMKA